MHILGSILILLVATSAHANSFGEDFWSHWGDGRAECSSYDLVYSRYGEARSGVAVAIFVTENFSNEFGVKADPGRHPESDVFPVMKLNLVQDFPTGIYDYNLMTSSFIALRSVNGRPAGSPTKVSFSSQEWCGHVWQQTRFLKDQTTTKSFSYFDGEADRELALAAHPEGFSEDALLLWARGLAGPAVSAGQSEERAILRSFERTRLRHQNLAWDRATFGREAEVRRVKTPAGEFDCRRSVVRVEGGWEWSFEVEVAAPHRIIVFERSDGLNARLRGSERLAYWQLNGPGGEARLSEIGLRPRAEGMP